MDPKVTQKQIHTAFQSLDSLTLTWIEKLTTVWNAYKKGEPTCRLLHEFFEISRNPFVSVLQAIVHCRGFHLGNKQNSLPCTVMEEFSSWSQKKHSNLSHLLKTDIKLLAFDVAVQQKNETLRKLIVQTYQMNMDKQLFVVPILTLVQEGKYKEACQCAVMLELYEEFKIEDFVIPLIFQDKYPVAEKFLMGNRDHQLKVVTFLDDLLGQKNIRNEFDATVRRLNISNVDSFHLQAKPLGKLIFKIVKAFDLPSTVCPNLMINKAKGVLHFLLKKHYVDKSINQESWNEMVLEAVGTNLVLQLFLVECLLCVCKREALKWTETFKIPKHLWPYGLKKYDESESVKDTSGPQQNISNSTNSGRKDGNFYKLPILESEIQVVDKPETFRKFLNVIRNKKINMVGVDAEWKPCFGFGYKENTLSLFQVATKQKVYILDIPSLNSSAPTPMWCSFMTDFIGNSKLLKLGFNVAGDLSILKNTLSKSHSLSIPLGFMENSFLDLDALWKTLVRSYNFKFPYSSSASSSSSSSGGLSTLIELCMGKTLDKSDRFSNWEQRPLRNSQIVYAALDAFCLLEAYNVIVRECQSQGIQIVDVVESLMNKNVFARKLESNCQRPKSVVSKWRKKNSNKKKEVKKMSLADYRIILDTTLFGVGKELRKCGVDTIILKRSDVPPIIRPSSSSESLRVFTQRRENLLKKTYEAVYVLKSNRLRDQITEMLNLLNTKLPPQNTQSRCLECNDCNFHKVPQREMLELVKRNSELPPAEEFTDSECEYGYYDDCQDENGHGSQQRSNNEYLIRTETIPYSVVFKKKLFYVCNRCGSCFWPNSHKGTGFRGFVGPP
ncbi:hypothetical protein RUM43_002613 [Polyplax serrata]|uniref:3'-5' exonuclease domain-containing protein n=1 Tax=Polyplax serrata TaxID=468196 RepID=A0AAN8PML9_POLSC